MEKEEPEHDPTSTTGQDSDPRAGGRSSTAAAPNCTKPASTCSSTHIGGPPGEAAALNAREKPTRHESNSEREKIMHRSVPLAEILLAFGVLAAPYSAAARCRLQVRLAGGSAFTRSARCIDADPACDSDSKTDSTCDFRASLCFSTDGVTACDHGDLLGMTIPSVPGLGGLPDIFEQFKATATPETICTDAATVSVATNGKKKGQV